MNLSDKPLFTAQQFSKTQIQIEFVSEYDSNFAKES